MKTKIITLISFLLMTVLKAENNQWMNYNESNSSLPDNSVKAIAFDSSGVWIGTIDGLLQIDGSDWRIYNSNNSELQNNYIRCISIDNTGKKWIGTQNGVVSIDNSPNQRSWNVFNSSNSGLPINNVTAVAIDNNNTVWFGTWGGGIAKMNNNIWETFNMYNSSLPVNGIYDIKVDNDNNVWIATHGGGLVRIKDNIWQVYNPDNSNISSNIIYAIDFDTEGNIWLGAETGLIKFDGLQHWTSYNSFNTGWNFTSVMCVKYDELSNNLYFGTYYGLGIYNNGNFSFKKTTNSSLAHNWISAINIDEDNNKWIATLGGGISIFNENGITISVDEINNFSEPNLSLYPNPAQDNFCIFFNNENYKNVDIKLYDITGKIVKTDIQNPSFPENKICLNIKDLPEGIYLCRVQVSDDVRTLKIIKA